MNQGLDADVLTHERVDQTHCESVCVNLSAELRVEESGRIMRLVKPTA
jgi:hypothetical protein